MTLEVPGLEDDLAELVSLQQRVVGERHGEIVFVVGDEGSGRGALLQGFAAELLEARARSVVLVGAFEDGRYVPRETERLSRRVSSVLDRVLTLGKAAALVADAVVPFAGLLVQVISRSQAAFELAESVVSLRDAQALPLLVPRVLRELCEDKGPVACVVDDADDAPAGWWADLVLFFARRVVRDMPLLLVLGVDGPRVLGDWEGDEASSASVARQLVADGLARWSPVPALQLEDLERWTGPAMPGVLEALVGVTGARAGWGAELWRSWQRREVVGQTNSDRRWRFTDRVRALDEVEDLLGGRLKRLVGSDDLNALERARRVLTCAALEGRRFTADAVALTLELSRDDLIDYLDETIAMAPEGLVSEDGSVVVADETGQRHLWLYRFREELDWLTLRHHGLTQAEEHHLSLRLAQSMRIVYGGEAHRVAATLARLYTTAGHVEDARRYRRMADVGVNRDLILWRAREIIAGPDPEDPSERTRSSHVLLAAAAQLFHSGPFHDGLTFAERANRLAVLRADRAEALNLSGINHLHLGDYEDARRGLTGALELARDLGNRRLEASARSGLASIDLEQGEYDKAERETLAVLELNRQLSDHRGEVRSHQQLGNIAFNRSDYDTARTEYSAALELARRIGERHGEGSARHMLAQIEITHGEYEVARNRLLALLELWRELGNRLGVGRIRGALGHIYCLEGEFEEARDEYLAARELVRELGDRHDEMRARQELVNINKRLSHYDDARIECRAVLELARQLKDQDAESEALRALQDLHEPAAE